ncbi:MFS transporter [Variovorax humicola]|uniref:MFS transporter n=1 Tax=Variovorax humicola TaxID=1769758 RepID=A0ABU8VV75_9BURK
MNKSVTSKGLLVVILLAIFVVPSSISGTAVALPAIGVDTHASLTTLQWVVNAFNLTFACFTLVWGALADAFGRKRCFILGAVLYSTGSLLSAMADSPLVLDLARALAGVGAAAIFSCGIALLSTHFDGAARMRAFAMFGTVAGLGVSLGPTLSGLVLDNFNWRAIFWWHTGALVLVLLGSPLIHRDKQRAPITFSHFDALGSLLFILALLALMIAIVQGSQWGWGSHGVRALIFSFVVLLAVFVWQEKRHRQPMLDLSLLANRRFVGMALVTVAASFGFVTLLTYLPSYLVSVLRLAPTEAGLTMLLLTLPMLVCPILAGRLVTHGVSPTGVLNTSLLCLLAGISSLAIASHPGMPLWQLAMPLLLVGVGMGLSAGLVDGMALKAVPEERAGMAAGLLNTFRLASEAIAVALYGSLLATLLGERLRGPLSTFAKNDDVLLNWINNVAAGNLDTPVLAVAAEKAELMRGMLIGGYDNAFHIVLWAIASILTALLALIAWLLIRPRKALVGVPQPF